MVSKCSYGEFGAVSELPYVARVDAFPFHTLGSIEVARYKKPVLGNAGSSGVRGVALQELNEKIFWIINADAGTAADWFMIAVTSSGYSLAAILLGFAAIRLYGGLNRKNVILFTAAVLIGGGVVHLLKQNLPLDRPLGYFAEKPTPMDGRVHAPFERPRHRTFPSGHTQTAFGVAMIVALMFKRHVALWFLWAALVALSRVYLGVHFPLDVVAGSLIGALAAFIVFRAQGLFFTTEDTVDTDETEE